MSEILNNRILKTEMVEWKKLIPFQPDNLKKTEPHKLQKLANSLCQNGFSMNFYVWETDGKILIIDGHSRQEVLQLLESGAIYPKDPSGKEYSVTLPEKFPCSFLALKNRSEAKKAVLLFNSKYKNIDSDVLAEWVVDLSLDELRSQIEIPEMNLDLGIVDELENDSIDDAAKVKTDIKIGDLIEIGKHRLLCGDSTKKEDVERLMNGNKADMVFTDPPYGIDYSGGRTQVVKEKSYGKLLNDDLEGEKLGDLIKYVFSFNKKEADIYICCSPVMQKPFLDFIEESTKKIDAVIVWDKKQAGLGYMAYRRQCEFILFVKGAPFKKGDNSDFDIWAISRDNGQDYEHGTQKPVEVPQRAIKNSSKKDDLVLDLFLGSGSTMVACQTLDRTCYGMELEPIYCQVIINRMRKNFPELEIKINGKEYKEG